MTNKKRSTRRPRIDGVISFGFNENGFEKEQLRIDGELEETMRTVRRKFNIPIEDLL